MEPNTSQTPEGKSLEEPREEVDPATVHQDSYRNVVLGQVSDPIYPPHPGEPESPEDELVRAALEDTPSEPAQESRPTPWRLITVILVTIVALAMVFLWR